MTTRNQGANMNKYRTEPAVIVSLIAAIIALAVSFGFDFTEDQVGSIMAVVVIVAGLVTRTQVTPAPSDSRHP